MRYVQSVNAADSCALRLTFCSATGNHQSAIGNQVKARDEDAIHV
jgi:hypothetical protein